MFNFIVIVVICLITVAVMNPVERWIKGRVASKTLAWISTFLISCVVLMALHCLADCLGLAPYKWN